MARYTGYKRPKDTRRALRELLHYMGYHRWLMLLVAVLVCISTGASVTGTYLLKPVINDYILPGDVRGLILALLFMGGMYLCGALSTFWYNRLMVKTSQKVVGDIRRDLFAHVQTLPLRYFDANTHGELMSRFTNDVDTIQEALNNSFTMVIQSALTLTGTVVMLIVLNVRMALIVIGFLLVMFWFIKWNGKRSKEYFDRQQACLADINGFTEEMVAGQKVEKIFNHEEEDMKVFREKNGKLRTASTKALAYSSMMIPCIVSLSYGCYAVSACAGALLAIAGMMDLGSLAAYLVYVRQSAMPLNQFTQQVNFILSALAGAERIFEMMHEEPEPDEGIVTLVRTPGGTAGQESGTADGGSGWAWKEEDGTLTPLKGDVRLENVVFGYVPGQNVLDGISLYAKPGQKIAFVGSTGAGKTTIINLINRFYEIRSGRILYDGIDIRRIRKDDLRRSLGMVIQDTHLFTGTIADNIRYGRPEATDEEVVAAAKLASADSFIRRLPDGYETMLYSDGSNLSQGQRQLLAIARAAAAQAPVLILDEATSSVDTRTERLIEKGMDALMEGRTVFVIAHRLSTVRNSKAILVLEHGTVIERGSHEELLDQRGRYYQLYTGMYELE
jgi:ATP-binding cassette subfamily B protein